MVGGFLDPQLRPGSQRASGALCQVPVPCTVSLEDPG